MKPEYEGAHRTQKLPACAVSAVELLRLYQTLQAKNDELFDDIAKDFNPIPGLTVE